MPLHIVDAEGSHFTDATGKRYLDLSSQLMCSNLGHKNRAVIDAIKQQAEELAFIAPGYTTKARAELCSELLEVLPKGLNKFFFTTSGTEANEAAIKIARMYTGKHKIISRYASYHGSTVGLGVADRRFPSLARRAARHRAGHGLRARRELLSLPAQEDVPRVRRRLRRLRRVP